MRVTENTNYDIVRNTINRSKERMENLQLENSTLRKLNTPSDDPVGASKVLEMRTDKVNNDQFLMNVNLAKSFLDNSDHAISDLAEIVGRAKEIAIGQSSGASSNDETRLGVSEEVTQLVQAAIATANRKIGDRYLFGGYKTQSPPVDPEGRYLGDDGHMMVEIGKDVFLSMNVPGIDAFNTNPRNSADFRNSTYGAQGQLRGPASTMEFGTESAVEPAAQNHNVFDELQNLRIALLTGDIEGVRGTLDGLDAIHSKLIATRAKVGSRISGLQTSTEAMERHNLTNAQLTSTLEDADMAQVASDLAKEETVFRSALASSHKLIQPTLLDFLK